MKSILSRSSQRKTISASSNALNQGDANIEISSELELLEPKYNNSRRRSSTFSSFRNKATSGRILLRRQIDDAHRAHAGGRWRIGAFAAALAATITAMVNVIVGAWTASLTRFTNPRSSGILVEIFHGNCGQAATMNTWSHLAINIVSTGLLAGSNYCMQCLVAPSRTDIDRAHRNLKWLDIGLPSVRNLRHISACRTWLWILLAVSSLPLHLLFNSSFFSSIASMNYYVVFAAPTFLEGEPFNYTDPAAAFYIDPLQGHIKQIQEQVVQDPLRFERLENSDCIRAYANDVITNRRSVIVVTSDIPSSENGSVLLATIAYTASPDMQAYPWICPVPSEGTPGLPQTYSYRYSELCSDQVRKQMIDPGQWKPTNITAEYCLSEKIEEHCGFYANIAIIWIIVACNIIKLAIMGHIVFSNIIQRPLMTIGDSVESFIVQPDPTTLGIGAPSIHTIKAICKDGKSDPEKSWRSHGFGLWQTQRTRLLRATSFKRWFLTIAYLVICICTIGGLLHPALGLLSGDRSLSALYDRGLGKTLIETVLSGWDISFMGVESAVVSSVLVANSPQLALSILYFAVNSILTSMTTAREWSHFSVKHAQNHGPITLRTSNPVGQQQRTYFLQLPFRFAIPLIVVSTILHWLISQSIFLVVISRYNADGSLDNPFEIATCGFSPIGMVFVIICGSFMLLVLVGLSLMKLEGGMPLVGSCSAAISAACHVNWPTVSGVQESSAPYLGEKQRRRMIKGRLVWGEMVNGTPARQQIVDDHHQDLGHCGFVGATDDNWREKVKQPKSGKSYT